MQCSFCNKTGHIVDTCYKKYGLPPHLRQRNTKLCPSNDDLGFNHPQLEEKKTTGSDFTPEQKEALLALLNKQEVQHIHSVNHILTQPQPPSHASAIEHGSGRKSLSESLVQDSNFPHTNLSSLPKQFKLDKEYNTDVKIDKNSDQGSFPPAADQRRNEVDYGNHGAKMNVEEKQLLPSEILNQQNQGFENIRLEGDDASFLESNKF
ncbi:hypothetical protein S83_036674 [Arachis hypogaea]